MSASLALEVNILAPAGKTEARQDIVSASSSSFKNKRDTHHATLRAGAEEKASWEIMKLLAGGSCVVRRLADAITTCLAISREQEESNPVPATTKRHHRHHLYLLTSGRRGLRRSGIAL